MKFGFSMSTPAAQPPELLRPARMSYIALTILAGALFNLLSAPELITRLKPDLIAMMVIYWTIYHPYRLGFTSAWLLGLFMDVANGSLFGEHALAYTLMLYLAGVFHRRIIMFPLAYQIVHVLVILLLTQVVTLIVRIVAGSDFPGFYYFLPSVTGAALWPLLTTVLRIPLRQSNERDAV
ncbi:MAG: rod shape-determining protein MreD [Burkholderiales bacterium]